MNNSFFNRLVTRETFPTNIILVFRAVIAYMIGLPLVFYLAGGLISLITNLLVNSVSALLTFTGVQHTHYKWLLTINGKAVHITGEKELMLLAIVLAVSLLWIKGRIIPKLFYIAGGILLFFLVHVLALFLCIVFTYSPLPSVGGNIGLGVNYVLGYALIKLYVQHHLIKKAA